MNNDDLEYVLLALAMAIGMTTDDAGSDEAKRHVDGILGRLIKDVLDINVYDQEIGEDGQNNYTRAFIAAQDKVLANRAVKH